MVDGRVNFEQIAGHAQGLKKFEELFDSSSKLMADALLNNGTIFCLGGSFCVSAAQQLTDLLTCSPEEMRPALPAENLSVNARGQRQFSALVTETDFAVFFRDPVQDSNLDALLDMSLEKGVASLLISPDLRHIKPTDKALEIRLEYPSFSDYLTSLSAVSNYLTRSIETLLFGRQV